jgi:hypothetical protein
MHEPITKSCLAEFHPFKQKTYKYHGWEEESQIYCSSCYHYIKCMDVILGSLLIGGMPTLYGNSTVRLTKEQAIQFLDGMYYARGK